MTAVGVAFSRAILMLRKKNGPSNLKKYQEGLYCNQLSHPLTADRLHPKNCWIGL
jgi:hypothetical protein